MFRAACERSTQEVIMSFWSELRVPTEHELLIGFYDLTGYMRYSEKAEPRQLLDLMAGYFRLTGQILTDAGGHLIKSMGDAGLAAFPAELADAGVLAFQSMQRQGDAWLAAQGYKTHAVVKLHLGPVAIGMVGAPGQEIIDVYGLTVNTAAQLPSTGLAMTPAVFRRLAPATRQLFKKHTPPISYIDAADSRPKQRG
jgi:class 3 adenylate cyclase